MKKGPFIIYIFIIFILIITVMLVLWYMGTGEEPIEKGFNNSNIIESNTDVPKF